MSSFSRMTDDYLRALYIPHVYQHDIYAIDYQRLRDAGITLLTFDIDDTIATWLAADPPKTAKTLMEYLKGMGFRVVLLTNNKDARGSHFSQALGVSCVAQAEKPLTANFQRIQARFGVEKSQMAHIGNSQTSDVAGGRAFGITTCMVRAVWRVMETGNPLMKSEGRKLREELLARGLWRKHHKAVSGDQYYQLGETPPYLR